MATTPQPDPSAGGAPPPDSGAAPGAAPGGAPQGGPSQAPANPKQVLLAQMYQLCKKISQEDPVLSPGMMKAAQGIQEAQTAMVSQPQPQPTQNTPPY